jgi:hypothetical protein
MPKNLKLALLATMLLLTTANAATIAVLEITPANDEMDLTINETKFLTDELRRQAMRILPKNYSVLTREKIITLIPATAENLNSVIDIGMVIKSDYVTRGSIGKLGNLFTLTVELYETSSGNMIEDFVKESTDLKGLLDAIRENAPALFSKLMPKEEPPAVTAPVIAKPEIANDTPSVATAAAIPTNIPSEPKLKTSFWVAIGLDVLGATAIGLGIYNNSKSNTYYKESQNILEDKSLDSQAKRKAFDDKDKKMQNAETMRNIFYATGGALLLGGIAVHIWF